MRKIIVLLVSFLPLLASAAKVPDWMSNRSSQTAYLGVGSCNMADANYQNVAEQRALSDLTKQISVLVETQSFLAGLEKDQETHEMFVQATSESAKNLLEGHEMVGSYTDKKNNTYFVCYQLDKQVYRLNKMKKEQEVAERGYSYLERAEQALNEGLLMRALTFYEQGLQEVEPWLFLDLRLHSIGREIDVPAALYAGYLSAFDGISLTATPEHLELFPGKQNTTVKVQALRRQVPLSNFPLQAAFTDGSGVISPNAKTDEEGVASFLLTSVSGKEALSQVRFSLSSQVGKSLSPAYRRLLSTQNWPEATLRIQTDAKPRIAYLQASKNDLPAAYRQIGTLLNNNHFDLTPDIDAAEIFIDLQCEVEYAGTVTGEIQNLNECYVTLFMRFYDNNTQTLLMSYNVEQLRVLTPEKSSYEQTLAQCTRELMKRVNRELPKKLSF